MPHLGDLLLKYGPVEVATEARKLCDEAGLCEVIDLGLMVQEWLDELIVGASTEVQDLVSAAWSAARASWGGWAKAQLMNMSIGREQQQHQPVEVAQATSSSSTSGNCSHAPLTLLLKSTSVSAARVRLRSFTRHLTCRGRGVRRRLKKTSGAT